jgi:hypothetical protein
LNTSNRKSSYGAGSGIFIFLLCLSTIFISFAVSTTLYSQSLATKVEIERLTSTLDLLRRELANETAEQEALRLTWQREAQKQEEQRRSWREEAAKYDAQCLARAQERLHQEEQRDEEERAGMHLFWDDPTPAPKCSAYGKRAYTARLWNIASGYDWIRACTRTPIILPGSIHALPDWCDVPSPFSGVIGHWVATTRQSSCEPRWGKFFDKECIGQGRRRVESRLWDVEKGQDAYQLCSTAPADIYGTHFDQPNFCNEREKDKAMIGNWEVYDPKC